MTGRFKRLAEHARPQISIQIDGQHVEVLQGDTLIVAILSHTNSLRESEFDKGSRAGFCLMGACQDCWIWTTDGERLRACSTIVREGLSIITRSPEAAWNLV
ncbi:(2Fe-2S)-binding protein [Pseudomonas sp. H1_B04]